MQEIEFRVGVGARCKPDLMVVGCSLAGMVLVRLCGLWTYRTPRPRVRVGTRGPWMDRGPPFPASFEFGARVSKKGGFLSIVPIVTSFLKTTYETSYG